MFLQLNHQKLIIYVESIEFLSECYLFCKHLPPDERYGLTSQIKRAALSVHLNLAEGASRKSPAERRRFYEVARSSLIEIDAAFDVAEKLKYFINYDTHRLNHFTQKCFKLLTGLINSTH